VNELEPDLKRVLLERRRQQPPRSLQPVDDGVAVRAQSTGRCSGAGSDSPSTARPDGSHDRIHGFDRHKAGERSSATDRTPGSGGLPHGHGIGLNSLLTWIQNDRPCPDDEPMSEIRRGSAEHEDEARVARVDVVHRPDSCIGLLLAGRDRLS
jgi:hypothetical protein